MASQLTKLAFDLRAVRVRKMRCRFGEFVQQLYLAKERHSSFWVEVVDEFPDGFSATEVAVVDGLKVSQWVAPYRSIRLLRSLMHRWPGHHRSSALLY